MILLGTAYKIENMVSDSYSILSNPKCKGNYSDNLLIVANSPILTQASGEYKETSAHKVFEWYEKNKYGQYIHKTDASCADKSLLFQAIELNCKFGSQEVEDGILAFCRKYGLLLSRAYLYHLGNSHFNKEFLQTYNQKYITNESMRLCEFVFLVTKMRSLVSAHTICYNKAVTDKEYIKAAHNPIFIFETLLTLLIPDYHAIDFNFFHLSNLFKDIDYLYDLLYHTYSGYFTKNYETLPSNTNFRLLENKNFDRAPFYPNRLAQNIPERLIALFEKIGSVLPFFVLDADISIRLSDKYQLENHKENYQTIYHTLYDNREEMIALVSAVSTCILNHELNEIYTYLYTDESELDNYQSPYRIAWHTISLYDSLILEIATMYYSNIGVTKCNRTGCGNLFIPNGHYDKMYCSTECKQSVSHSNYIKKRREKKAQEKAEQGVEKSEEL